jgi:HAD superfamily hydrolase (TIGR01549 family)
MKNGKINVKGIMFDLDGTILDTRPAYIEAARIAFKAIGQQAPADQTALEIPKRMEQKQPLDDIVKTNINGFKDVYLKTFYAVSASKTQPFPNTAAALSELSRKAKLVVITMRFVPCKSVVSELEHFHLDQYFVHVLTALDTHRPKPSPEALIKAVAAMDVQMCDCLIVGDSVVDVEAGKAAGAKTVSVLTGLYSRNELEKASPNYILNNVSELANLVA